MIDPNASVIEIALMAYGVLSGVIALYYPIRRVRHRQSPAPKRSSM